MWACPTLSPTHRITGDNVDGLLGKPILELMSCFFVLLQIFLPPPPPHLLFAMHNIACIVSNSVAWCSWHVCMWCTVCHQYAGRLLCGGTLHSAPASSRCSGLHLRQLRQPHPGKLHLQKPSTHYCKLLPLGGFVCLTAPCCVTGDSHMWACPVCLISRQDHARVELIGCHVLDVPHCCSCFQ